MVEFKNFANFQPVTLLDLSEVTSAADAAQRLWSDIHQQTKVHGGRALIRTPDNGENGFVVFWEDGPTNWATNYADAPQNKELAFSVKAEDGTKIRLTD